MGGGSLGNLIIRRRFDGVNQVRELDSILDEEDRNVVSNNVKVALISVATMVSTVFAVPRRNDLQPGRETMDIACRVGATPRSGHS